LLDSVKIVVEMKVQTL